MQFIVIIVKVACNTLQAAPARSLTNVLLKAAIKHTISVMPDLIRHPVSMLVSADASLRARPSPERRPYPFILTG
jgi:hypothetical protein